jgi:hypothetical protein
VAAWTQHGKIRQRQTQREENGRIHHYPETDAAHVRKEHLYRPAVKEKETQRLLLDRFLETAFGGSAMKLVMQALGSRETSKEEISRIREFLDNLEGDKQ